jgi:hypothetical protein
MIRGGDDLDSIVAEMAAVRVLQTYPRESGLYPARPPPD